MIVIPVVFADVFPRTVLLPRDSSTPLLLYNPQALSVAVQFEARTVPARQYTPTDPLLAARQFSMFSSADASSDEKPWLAFPQAAEFRTEVLPPVASRPVSPFPSMRT